MEYSNGAKVWKQVRINGRMKEKIRKSKNDYHTIEFGTEQVFFLKDGSSVFLVGNEHNPDGPAYTHPDGTIAWCLDGEIYTFDTWCKKTKKTLEEIVKLKLRYM